MTHPTSLKRPFSLILILTLVATILAPPGHAQPTNLVTNGDFTSVGGDGLPTGWSRWRPAGDATFAVEPGAGPNGGNALRIAATPSSDTSDRLALVQRITVDDGIPRTLELSGWMKAENLVGGWTSLRIQARNATNGVVLPVKYVGRDTGTFAWRRVSEVIEIPQGTTAVTVEPMLDRSGGTVWFADIALRSATSVGNLKGSVTAAGVAELFWDFGLEDAHRYEVLRIEGDQVGGWTDEHRLGTAWAQTWADHAVKPGTTYTYVVRALARDGAVLAVADPLSVRSPATFVGGQVNSVVTALRLGGGVHVSWRLAANADSTGLALVSSPRPITDTRPPAQQVAHVEEGSSSATLPTGTHRYLALVRGSEVLASTAVGELAHPRSDLTPRVVEQIRERIVTDATVRGAWRDLLNRVETGTGYSNNTAGALYRARDAAFVHQVTGEKSWAERAHEYVMQGSDHVRAYETNMGLELGRANLLLAPVYDWSYDAWTNEQRAEVRQLIMKASDLLSTYHHDALDNAQKTSNWVAVARTTELAALLVIRGDGEADTYDERIAFLADQTMQHLDTGYTDEGYTQEGWDYFHYGALYMLPAAYSAVASGMVDLVPHLERPQWWNMTLHTVSARTTLDAAQWGVGGQRNQTHGILPLLMPLTPKSAQPGLRWTYDVTRGLHAPTPLWDNTQNVLTVMYWQPGAMHPRPMKEPDSRSAILDDEAGQYWFRSGFTGPDDVLVALANRNLHHKGWSGSETFGLSMMGLDTTWAVQGGKSLDPLHWSKPLVDGRLEPRINQYETVRGEGVTLGSRSFAGQGGGYVDLDGSANFEVETARREAVVDLPTDGPLKAVVAIDDEFGDGASHQWDWQLRPDSGVGIQLSSHQSGAPTFTFASGEGTLRGWVVGEGWTIENVEGTVRIRKEGQSARFQVVLVLTEKGAAAAVGVEGAVATVGDRVFDLDDLGAYRP